MFIPSCVLHDSYKVFFPEEYSMPRNTKKILNYNEAQRALEEVDQGFPVATAAGEIFPRVTLLYKPSGRTPLGRKMGPEKAFTINEERIIVKWITTVEKMGFPVTNEDLLNSVKQLTKDLRNENFFKNGRPTYGWLQRFRRRRPEISARTAQNLTNTRASVKKENILAWFNEVHGYLLTAGYENVLLDPKRVFNGDETTFFSEEPQSWKSINSKKKCIPKSEPKRKRKSYSLNNSKC